MSSIRAGAVLALLIASVSCESEVPAPRFDASNTEVVVAAVDLRHRSVAEIDSLLGKPTDTASVPSTAGLGIDQTRTYEVGGSKVGVEFIDGKASQVQVEYSAANPESRSEAFLVVGLSEGMLRPAMEGTDAPVWTAPEMGLERVVLLPGQKDGRRTVMVAF